MSAPQVKGWCPSAHRPMMSGDGLIVRVRPKLGEMTRDQAIGLCDLATNFGSGVIDLTSRANLQIRGVHDADHTLLIDALVGLGLLNKDPLHDRCLNIVTTPIPDEDGVTRQLFDSIAANISLWPNLPNKMGIALDTGPNPLLQDTSADFRLERGENGALILRADGNATGMNVTPQTAARHLIEMASWFVETNGPAAGRMARHLRTTPLPPQFQGTAPKPSGPKIESGQVAGGFAYGAPFGTLDANLLRDLILNSNAEYLRLTPWRIFVLLGGQAVETDDFITSSADPLLRVYACPGQPNCEQAHSETRQLARDLAPTLPKNAILHVSGCAKGCAFPRPATVTVVGTPDGFTLATDAAPWDSPYATGLSAQDIKQELAD